MFIRAAFVISLALLQVGQTTAIPFFAKSSDMIARSAEPLEAINIVGRQIPAEIAVKAPDGNVVPYSKREEEELLRRDIPAEIAVKAPDGVIVPYTKREFGRRDIPAEIAVKAPDGVIIPYSKREEQELARREIPEEVPVKAPDGNIVPYKKRDSAADELVIRDSAFPERRYISPEIPTRSLNGVIELYN